MLKRENLIQSYTTIGQRFDLVFGVACRTKGGSDGYIVKGRSREGGSFTELPFSVDPDTNYMTEKKSLASRAAETRRESPGRNARSPRLDRYVPMAPLVMPGMAA